MLLYTYTKVDGSDFNRQALGEVSGVKLRRLTVNLSKQGPLFQEMKWSRKSTSSTAWRIAR